MRLEDSVTLIDIQNRSYERAGPGILESYPQSLAMDVHRLAAFLEGKRYAVLATSRPDGRAQAAPVAFTVWDGAFWFASVPGARVRNLRARSYAAAVVTEGEGKVHRAVIAEGAVRLIEANSGEVPAGLLVLWRERHGGAPTWAAMFVELRPRLLFSYDATKQMTGS